MIRLPLVLGMLSRYQSWAQVPLTLTVDQVAGVLGISRSSAYRLIQRGRINAVRISQRKIVVSKDELRRFLGLASTDATSTSDEGGELDGAEY